MDAHKNFDEMYELFVEEFSHRIQSIYVSKFYKEIGNCFCLSHTWGEHGRNIQATKCVLGGKSRVKAVTLFLTPLFRLNS